MAMASRGSAKLAFSSLLAASSAAYLVNTHGGSPSPHFGYLEQRTSLVSRAFSSDDDSGNSITTRVSKSLPGAITKPRTNADIELKILNDRFRVGDHYIWLYKDESGAPSSWEKYTVTNTGGDGSGILTIEMATKFSEDAPYFTHHRMVVELAAHLNSRDDKTGWQIGFDFNDPEDGWRPFGSGDNVQAFEEKFDVFSMILASSDESLMSTVKGEQGPEIRNVTIDADTVPLTRSNRHNYTEAWYGPYTHWLSGVAVLKDFNEHSFSLVEMKRAEANARKVDVEIQGLSSS